MTNVKAKSPAKSTKSLGIKELAKMMKVEPATVRVKLRKAKVKKTGKSYAWTSAAEMSKVASKLNATAA